MTGKTYLHNFKSFSSVLNLAVLDRFNFNSNKLNKLDFASGCAWFLLSFWRDYSNWCTSLAPMLVTTRMQKNMINQSVRISKFFIYSPNVVFNPDIYDIGKADWPHVCCMVSVLVNAFCHFEGCLYLWWRSKVTWSFVIVTSLLEPLGGYTGWFKERRSHRKKIIFSGIAWSFSFKLRTHFLW